MKTQDIYNLGIKMGINSDLRGTERVKEYLSRYKKRYNKLDSENKKKFDIEQLTNPYSDSRILNNTGREIKKIIVGIDMESPELLLANQMGVDLVLAHHPEGAGLADLHNVMDLQSQVLADLGVPINIAEQVLKPRISEVGRSVHPINHYRSVDMAKLLDIDYMCIHTPADNLGANFLVQKFDKANCEYVEDVLKVLENIPEYIEAVKLKTGPKLFTGSPENRCGKVVVTEFTGGTSGAKEIYEKMSQAGIGTIISMHMSEAHRKEAEKFHLNVVIAGHIASDSIGMNLLLDELEKNGIEIIPASGLIRVKR